MKAAMNGVPNLSILDGWWPEGCQHGVTGWKIGDPEPDDDQIHTHYAGTEPSPIDDRDRLRLYDILEHEVMPAYYSDRERWIRMMKASIAMSQWKFSSDRMVQEYFTRMYRT
jgi:starch phosphorylase